MSNTVHIKFQQAKRGRTPDIPLVTISSKQTEKDPQLCKISSIFKKAQSFLTITQLAIINLALKKHLSKKTTSLNILSFLSFQMDQRTEKGIALQITNPQPTKGLPVQTSTKLPNEPGKHHATLQCLRKIPHRDEAKSQ